jgi:hypothetical protein
VQDKDANKIWLVVVKATFDIQADGACRLAEEQLPVLRTGEHLGKPGSSSLIYESDLQGLKSCTDILVHGNAWAPKGRAATSVDVELSVGPVQKRLRVFGDRIWERSAMRTVTASPPLRFESMPMIYERAYGGWDKHDADPGNHRLEARNPTGTGFALNDDGCVGQMLPNIEYPNELIGSYEDRPSPAGFNAVECHWSPRRELAGTYDSQWREHRFPLWAEDFDTRYHNCAPADQQAPGFLRGGEPVRLVNLCSAGDLMFTLPRIYPFFETRFGSDKVEHRAQLCTVIVEPDLRRLLMSWQTSLVCNHRVDELDMTVVTEKQVI